MTQRTTLTRAQLFDLVWSKPMLRLGQEYAASNVALAKLCARRDIPTPPRGYWAQLAAGKSPRRPKLPPSADDSPITLPPLRSEDAVAGAVDDAPAKETVVVAERLSSPHELVGKVRDALTDAKEGADGMLHAPKGGLSIQVSRKVLGHALRVADALLKVCENRQWPVKAHADGAVISVEGIPIKLAISEEFERIEAPPEPSSSYHSFNYNRPRYASRPSGHLAVSIDSLHHVWHPGVRRSWRGSEKRPIEACLPSVILGLKKLADVVRADMEEKARREQQELERERAEEQARVERERVQRAAAEEKARVERLLGQVQRWQLSQNLRALIEVAQQPGSGRLDMQGKDLASWVEWASRQADRLDPFEQPSLAKDAGQLPNAK